MKYLASSISFFKTILTVALLVVSACSDAQIIKDFACGIGDGRNALAYGRLNFPGPIAVDGAGNIFVADLNNFRIRKITAATGIITTIAGTGMDDASFSDNAIYAGIGGAVSAMAIDNIGNLYAVNGNAVYKIDAAGHMSIIAGIPGSPGFSGDGGLAITARFQSIGGIAIDATGNIFVSDVANRRVRKIGTDGIVGTVAGGGASLDDGVSAVLARVWPGSLTFDPSGNLYISELTPGHNSVRKMTPGGIITTLAAIYQPFDIKSDASGNIFVTHYSDELHKIYPSGIFSTVMVGGLDPSEGIPATLAPVDVNSFIAFDGAGNLYMSNRYYNTIRVVNTAGIINTCAGNKLALTGFNGDGGSALLAQFNGPAICVDRPGNVYVADVGNQRVRKINTSGIITTIAGTGFTGHSGDGGPATAAILGDPSMVAADYSGNIYVGDAGTAHVRKISTSGVISAIAGGGASGLGEGGPATAAQISMSGIAADSAGNVFIADLTYQRIRKVAAGTGIITTIAGTGAAGFSGDGAAATAAQINNPLGIAVDKSGNVYFTDNGNNRIRKIDLAGNISTFAGNGTTASANGWPATSSGLNAPSGLTIDKAGNLYIADVNNYQVSKVDRYNFIHTVAGNGVNGYMGEGMAATAAELQAPQSIAIDTSGQLYIQDGSIVRKVCCMVDNPDRPPVVTHGNIQSIQLCASSAAIPIDTFLTISDPDAGDKIKWSILLAPGHGMLGGFSDSVIIPGGIVIPSELTYTPATSFAGIDSFKIIVDDGYFRQPVTIIVTLNSVPYAGVISGDGSVCVGSAITLFNGAPGGTWSSANSRASVDLAGLVTGVTAGPDTIKYSVANGCGIAAAIRIINVNPLPVSGTITGPTTLCTGYSASLSNIGASGAGLWSCGDPYLFVNSFTGAVAGVAAGSAIVTYSVSNVCGSASDTAIITVQPVPSAGAIAGTTTLCTGGATNLTNPVTGGTWSSGNPLVASVSSTGVVSGLAAGAAIISYTVVAPGCGSAITAAIVNITSATPIAPVTGVSSLCAGSTTVFNDASPTGTWSSSNPFVASVSSSGVVTGVAPGAATISYTASLGCGVSVATGNITVLTAAVAGTVIGPGSVCTGASAAMSSTATGGIWSAGNGNVSISPSGIITGINVGTSTITYTVTNSCGTAIATQTINVALSPVAGVITGSATVCAGAATTFSNTTSSGGGVWSSSNPAIAITGTGGDITGISAGIATISYTVTTGCGILSATKSIIVIVQTAGVIGGITSLCAGNIATLTSTVAGGTWSSSNPTVATIGSTGVVTSLAGGASVISYTVAGACGTTTTTTIFTVSSLPVVSPIMGSTAICLGGVTALTNATLSGVWSSGNPSVAMVGSTGLITSMSVGSAVITYLVTAGCGTTGVTAIINVDNLPIAPVISGSSSVCAGTTMTLSAGSGGGIWSSSNILIATAGTGGIITGMTAGTATISYTVGNVCGAATGTKNIAVNVPDAGTIVGLTTLCPGTSTTLLSSVAGGVWSSSVPAIATITAGGIVNAITSGTSIISYSVTGDCGSASTTSIFTIGSLPIVAPVAGIDRICKGTGAMLTDATTGGHWFSSDMTVATVDNSGVITGVSEGTSIISYMVTAGCGTAGVTFNVTIEDMALAGAISGKHSLCAGATTLLTASAANGNWSSSDILTATVNPVTGALTGIKKGNVTISYSVTNTCGTNTATADEAINSVPDAGLIAGKANICEHEVAEWINATTGGTWSSADPLIAMVDVSGRVTGITAGSTFINYTVGNSCGSGTASKLIGVDPMPVIMPISGGTSVEKGKTTTLADGVQGGLWGSDNNSIASIGADGVVTGVYPGDAMISYILTNSSGCSAVTSILLHVVSEPGMVINNGFNIYPNPAAYELTISWHDQIISNADVRFMDVAGREVFQTEINMTSPNGQTQMRLPNVSPGTYTISIKSLTEFYTGKITILN